MFRLKSVHTILRSRTALAAAAGAVCLLGAAVLINQHVLSPKDPFAEANAEISKLKDEEYQRYFSKKIDVFFREEGMNGIIQRVITAFEKGQITMFVCHSLAHDIGHYGGYPENFANVEEYISKENLDFCGSGFMHGIEAQLAIGPYAQNIKDLHYFCSLVMPKKPYYDGCFHGAGHSFMEVAQSPQEALEQCDRIKTDESIDVSDCYRGVYSEYADTAHRLGKDNAYLLSFCSDQPGVMQAYCAEELNGLEIPASATEAQIEAALRTCVDEAYARVIQLGCVRSVASIATDRILGHDNRVIMPSEFVFTLAQDFRRTYIEATRGSFVKTKVYDESRSLDAFCDAFPESEDRTYCHSVSFQ